MFRSKNYKESAKLVDRSVLYDAQDAFKLVCDASITTTINTKTVEEYTGVKK